MAEKIGLRITPDEEARILDRILATGIIASTPQDIVRQRASIAEEKNRAEKIVETVARWTIISTDAEDELTSLGYLKENTNTHLNFFLAEMSPILKGNGINISSIKGGDDITGIIEPIRVDAAALCVSVAYYSGLLEVCIAEPMDENVNRFLAEGMGRLYEHYKDKQKCVGSLVEDKERIERDILLTKERIFNNMEKEAERIVEKKYRNLQLSFFFANLAAGKDIVTDPIKSDVQLLVETGFAYKDVAGCFNGIPEYFGDKARAKYDSQTREAMQHLRKRKTHIRISEQELYALYNHAISVISYESAKEERDNAKNNALRQMASYGFISSHPRLSSKYGNLKDIDRQLEKETRELQAFGAQLNAAKNYLEKQENKGYGFENVTCMPIIVKSRDTPAQERLVMPHCQ